MKNKKAAMEMSVGTIVTIVLLMSVLVLGIFLVQRIFTSATNAIDSVDTKTQSEIDRLFSTDDDVKISLIPREGEILRMKKGQIGGFGFAIRNMGMSSTSIFSYDVSVKEVTEGCTLTIPQAEKLISLGSQGEEMVASGDQSDYVFVRYSIPDSVPICLIRYTLVINQDNNFYDSANIDLCIGKCGL